MNAGSNLHVSEVEFNGSIIANDNSQVTIEKKAKFSEHSTLELSESSLIEFGNAAIEGICKEIKLLRNDDSLPALTKLEEQNSLSPSQIESEEGIFVVDLICGSNFDCPSWKARYNGTESSFYKYARCVENEGKKETCLSLSNVQEKSLQKSNKKKLSNGVIAAIVVAAVVVIIAIIVGVVFYIKKSSIKYGLDTNSYDDEFSVGL
ncbi:hypothetical protein M9Y10_024814 [Tritrichomonas musculus]|uniref:Uncharacterized protein n=1 Tax=Tritrichomonas musculus TaxID=1915356 RepID=A0ABR2HCJ4_9EUKA